MSSNQQAAVQKKTKYSEMTNSERKESFNAHGLPINEYSSDSAYIYFSSHRKLPKTTAIEKYQALCHGILKKIFDPEKSRSIDFCINGAKANKEKKNKSVKPEPIQLQPIQTQPVKQIDSPSVKKSRIKKAKKKPRISKRARFLMKDYSKDYSYMPDKYLTDETSYQEKYSKFDLKKVASSRIPKECEKEPNNKNQEWIYGRYFKLHVSINNFQNLDIELVSKLLQALVDDERITEFKLAQQVDKGRFADNDQITVYLNNFLSLADIQEIASAIRDKIKELEIPDNEQCLGEKDVFSLNNYVSARCDTNFINGDYGVYHFFDHEIRKYYEKNNDSNLTLKAIKFVFLNMLLRDDIEINAEELSEQDSHKVQEQFALADDPMQNDKYIVGGFMPEGLWELAFDKLKVYQETTQNRIVERNEKEQLDVLNTMKEVFIGSKESTTENLVNVSMFQPAPKETNNNNNSISLTQ